MKTRSAALLICSLATIIFCFHQVSNAYYFDLETSPFEVPTTEQLVTGEGFPYEKHTVTTSDGFILTLHRIPSQGPPVLLQHGVLDSGSSWVFTDAENSLAYMLSQAGFDVWLGNCRGASKHHVHHAYDDPEFWDWNTDHLIQIDLPSMVNYVVGATKFQQLSFVGHSMGALLGFTGFSQENSQLSSKIRSFVALAPAASFKKPASIIDRFAPHPTTILDLLESAYNFISPTSRLHSFDAIRDKLFVPVCSRYPGFCREILCGIAGCKDTNLFHLPHMSVTFSLYPAEASFLNLKQFAQWEVSQKVAMFDYGVEENQIRYGSAEPKTYNISDLAVPVAIYYGGQDRIVSPYRVRAAIEELPEDKVHKVGYFHDYGHADFVWGTECKDALFPQVVTYLGQRVELPVRTPSRPTKLKKERQLAFNRKSLAELLPPQLTLLLLMGLLFRFQRRKLEENGAKCLSVFGSYLGLADTLATVSTTCVFIY